MTWPSIRRWQLRTILGTMLIFVITYHAASSTPSVKARVAALQNDMFRSYTRPDPSVASLNWYHLSEEKPISIPSSSDSTLEQLSKAPASVASNLQTTILSPPPPAIPSISPTGSDLGNFAGSSQLPAGFNSEAHKIGFADGFLPHFRAVSQLPVLSMDAAKATCHWEREQDVNFMFGPSSEWYSNPPNTTVLDDFRKGWQNYVLNEAIPFGNVSHRFNGRGIVIVAGDVHNTSAFKRLKVLLRALLNVGSTLPVEVHYWDDEMSRENKTYFKGVYDKIEFMDLSSPDSLAKTGWKFLNYQFKTAAMLNTRFAEPILMDSDNVPVVDPAVLYESPTYREFGSVFWPDIARTRKENPMWSITNTPCRMDEYEMESGQLIVDKRKFWYHLQLAAWMNHQEWYDTVILGDKDKFRFAWYALKTRYGRPRKWLASVGFSLSVPKSEAYRPEVYVQKETGFENVRKEALALEALARKQSPFEEPEPNISPNSELEKRQADSVDDITWYCGDSFAQHHPDTGDVLFVHGGNLKTISAPTARRVVQNGGGFFQKYKRSAHDEDWSHVERVDITWWNAGQYIKAHPLPNENLTALDISDNTSRCVDMFDVDYRSANEVLPGFEEQYKKAGGYWTIDEDYRW